MTRACVVPALAVALLLAACGERSCQGPSTGGSWRQATLTGVAGVTAAAHHEGWLLFAAGDQRRIFALPAAALTPSARAQARALPIEVLGTRLLEGHGRGGDADQLALQGYTLGQVWDQPLDFAGLCVRRVVAGGAGRDVDRLYLLDRAHGVVFWGRLERAGDGAPERVVLEHAFAVPGRERAGAARLDWRDTSRG